ncbi:MAG: immunoglobulin-like domain-containing protein [Bacillota bacterium]
MKRVSSLLIVFAMVFTVAACTDSVEDIPEEETYDEQLYEIYQLGVEAGAVNETYEEWLESVEGTDGEDGREMVLSVSDTHIQWQYEGEDQWRDLIGLEVLRGPQGEDGRDIVFSISDSHIQWQYDGEDTWRDLIDLETLRGPQGETGPSGPSAYDIYIENHPEYEDDESQWLDDLVNGRLGEETGNDQSTIRLELNGGEVEGPSEITSIIGYEIDLPTPEKDGYSFEGWYKDSLLEHPFSSLEMPSDSLTIYAKWKANSVTITFDSNGGSTVESINQKYGTDVEKPENPTKDDYVFDGWYLDDTFSEAFEFNEMPPDDIKLYAKWTNDELMFLEQAKDILDLDIENEKVKMDLYLPTTLDGYSAAEISWTSSHPEIIAEDGTVTRPGIDEDDEAVTLTATLSYNGEAVTKEFVLMVAKSVATQSFSSFTALYELSPVGDPVTIQGVVTSEFDGGVFVYDGNIHMAIYDSPTHDIDDLVELGDEIKYTGIYADYHSLYQVKDRSNLQIISTGNEYDFDPQSATIEELYNNYDPHAIVPDVHGQHFTVQGTITQKGTYNNFYIESTASSAEIEIYYQSLPDSLTAIENHLGDVVELELVYYLLNTDGTIRMLYQYDDADILPADTQGKLDSDIEDLEDTWTDGDDITLPATGAYGTQFSGWTSSDTSLIGDDGSFISTPASITTVTMGGTAQLQTFIQTASFEVTVLSNPSDINTALNAAIDDPVHTKGVVYAQFNGGYYIFDGTSQIVVYTAEDISDQAVVTGDEVEVYGRMNKFNSLYQIADVQKEEIVSSGNSTNISVDDTRTISDIVNLDSNVRSLHGKAFEVTGILDIRGQYNNVYIDDPNTSDSLLVYYRGPSDSIAALENHVGETVTLTVMYHMDTGTDVNVLYQNGENGIVPGTVQGKFDADIAELEDMWTDGDDITLPTTGTYGTQFSGWTSSDTSLIGDDGSFITTPASITTITMGGTAELQTLIQTVSFEVTVLSNPTDIDTALNDTVDSPVHTNGIVYAQFNGGYFIYDGSDSISIYNDKDIVDQTVIIGDEVEVYGQINKYNSLYQIADVQKQEILSTGNTLNLPVEDTLAISDIVALDSTNRNLHGQAFEVTGILDMRGQYNNVYIDDPDSSESIEVYYRAPEDSIIALENLEGSFVTLTVIYFMDSGTDVYVLYQNGVSGITENTVMQDFYSDIADLEDKWTSGDDITMPATGTNGTQFSGWTSSDTALIGDDGTFITTPASTSTITMSGTATLQTLTKSVTFDVTIQGTTPMSIDAALNASEGDYIHTQGIIYGQFNAGYFIHDGSDSMVIHTGELITNQSVNIGDEVEVAGQLVSNHSRYQMANLQLESILSSNNTPSVPVDSTHTISDVAALDSSNRNLHGQAFEVTGIIKAGGPYNNMYLEDTTTGEFIMFYYQSPNDSLNALELNVGETVTLTVYYFMEDSDGVYVIYQNGSSGIAVQ